MMNRLRVSHAGVLLAALIVSGCAGLRPAPGPEAEAPPAPAPTPAPAQERAAPPSGPAVVALLDQADREMAQGHSERAAAALERALNIEPRNPVVWTRMAALHLAQGRPRQAESFALRANSLAAPYPALRARNWSIIAAARRQIGDAAGADEARAHAASLKNAPR